MSEEEKINQPTYDNPSIEENKTLAEALTDNNQPTTNMEVHKHPHHVTHKKKWGECLLSIKYAYSFFARLIIQREKSH